MKVTFAIPFRGGQVDREIAFNYTRTYLQLNFPSAGLVVADTDHEPFNRAAARNAAVREAGSGVVIVCDADSLPERDAVEAAVEAASDGCLHLPYTVFQGLSREHTLRVLVQDYPLAGGEVDLVSTWSVGGCVVMDHDAYFDAGGQDEGFIGWGGEDVAFFHACETLLGPHTRHDGTLFGLWHPSEMDKQSAQYRKMAQRQNRYRAARGNPDAIRELVRGR